jgi:Divergent InlB B-repeat domain
MRKFCCSPRVCNGLIRPVNTVGRQLLLIAAILAAFPLNVSAVTIAVQVIDGSGGRVTNVPSNTGCQQNCIIRTASETMVSLFAIPDKDYRFQGWDGACVNTIGPLCTLKTIEDSRVIARFVKSKSVHAPIKALLLLHDIGDKPIVWNEFVNQNFNNRCPVIYGGVVLAEDSFNPHNKVYCYRIAFGYYDLLNVSKTTMLGDAILDGNKKNADFFGKQLSNEVAAAVLGILNRYPQLSLTLVGQASAASAAQHFLQINTVVRADIVGLLALQRSGLAENAADHEALGHVGFKPDGAAYLSLDANPKQVAKISAALEQLPKSWWIAR